MRFFFNPVLLNPSRYSGKTPAPAQGSATGGDEYTVTINSIEYRVHEFLYPGEWELVVTGTITGVEYLIVGGGGGATAPDFPDFYEHGDDGDDGESGGGGGGGGGGSVVTNADGLSIRPPVTLTAGTYPVEVADSDNGGGPGQTSSFFGMVANGGGVGGAVGEDGSPGRNNLGGSGGGGGAGGVGGPGVSIDDFFWGFVAANNGGTAVFGSGGAGGGGAGAAGEDAAEGQSGNGGDGLWSSMSRDGTQVCYGGGGGGSGVADPETGEYIIPPGSEGAGANGPGGGANGVRSDLPGTIANGNPGIVVVRYPLVVPDMPS